MFFLRNTVFMLGLLACGVAICSVVYYSHATVESRVLSEWQLGKIYAGQDCENTSYVEGCATEGHDAHFVPLNKASDWNPPVKEDGETTEAYSVRYLNSRPDCGEDIETVVYGGTSATGADREPIGGDAGKVVCSKIWPVTRSSVKENARAAPPDIDLGTNTRCVVDVDVETHCVVCEVGDGIPGSPRQRYQCPDDNGV